AIATMAGAVVAHHQAALDRWNAVLIAAGQHPVVDPPSDLKASFDGLLARAPDGVALARLALQLEQTLSDTYLAAVAGLQSPEAVTLAGQLQAVDQEHAATLHYLLGGYPAPGSFQTTEKAVKV
ncbi:MAG: ferritin-like domain-containing protein, partial [Actinomycetota bacterium]|nr:ferritin-like domain-containing protein [Actinomycetota bacterium]